MYLRNRLLVPHPAARILRKGNGIFDFVRGSGYVGFHSCLAKELSQLVMEFRNALAGNCEAFGKARRCLDPDGRMVAVHQYLSFAILREDRVASEPARDHAQGEMPAVVAPGQTARRQFADHLKIGM